MNAATLIQKLCNYCNVLRDDGMSYGDYVEQLGAVAAAQIVRGAILVAPPADALGMLGVARKALGHDLGHVGESFRAAG